MEIVDPPYPSYRDVGILDEQNYRVVSWAHQLPTPGIEPDQMGWAELTWDVNHATDVHEVIAWADKYLVDFAEEYPGQSHTYCLYARLPRESTADVSHYEVLLRIAGTNPTEAVTTSPAGGHPGG